MYYLYHEFIPLHGYLMHCICSESYWIKCNIYVIMPEMAASYQLNVYLEISNKIMFCALLFLKLIYIMFYYS